jgi:hypothetical protein
MLNRNFEAGSFIVVVTVGVRGAFRPSIETPPH